MTRLSFRFLTVRVDVTWTRGSATAAARDPEPAREHPHAARSAYRLAV